MTDLLRVVVWGTGNVGLPAIRAVVANPALELSGVVVSNPAKVGLDAGVLAGIDPTGVLASDDIDAMLASKPDAVVYTASGDFRPIEAITDVLRCLGAGCNVVSPSIYPLYHPASAPPELMEYVNGACAHGESTMFASGIDPGWALDLLPMVLSGVAGSIDEIRMQEIFNYATYYAPDAVRDLVGFGTPATPRIVPAAMAWGEGWLRDAFAFKTVERIEAHVPYFSNHSIGWLKRLGMKETETGEDHLTLVYTRAEHESRNPDVLHEGPASSRPRNRTHEVVN
jgi:hypothetical protein